MLRRAFLLENGGKMEKYIAIDVGGTAIKYGLVNAQGEVLESGKCATEAHLGGPSILEKVIHICEKLFSSEVKGIGISTAGMVDIHKGEIFFAGPTIPNYAGTQYKKILEERFSVPCEVENDVNCAGLAEARSGAGRNAKSMVCLTIGTGIGGCIILGNQLLHGHTNSACEIGYMHLAGGQFQNLGATSILSQRAAQLKNEAEELWSGYRVFEEAKKGDQDCQKVIEEMIDVLGQGIANICYVLNPEAIILGGGIMEQGEHLRKRIEDAVKKYLLPALADHTKILVAEHKNHAGLLGAFYHWKHMQNK